ncbi:MAG: hypothetical protein J5486_10690 [Bacteroidaceae bacterium]|nr:hypothetical protein [Bacteroidaceae bacterium]
MLKFLLHYGLHFGAPILLAMLFKKEHRRKALYIMWCTMIVDIDHILASPVFQPERMSVGYHPLHSIPAIAAYVILFGLTFILPAFRIHAPWWLRPICLGLLFHMFTDWLDFALWH